jgi:hypothetical protein
MATKKAASKKVAVAPAIAIPAVRTTGKTAAPAKPMSAADMLNQLAGAKPVEKKSTAASKGRPALVLTPDAESTFKKFIPAKVLYDQFESNLTAVKDELKTQLFVLYAHTMWIQKSQPANPKLLVLNDKGKSDMESLYVIQAKFKVQADSAEVATQLLVGVGLSQDNAEKLVEHELDFTPFTGLRSFNELVKGHREGEGWVEATPAEQAVAQKLMSLVMGQQVAPITPEERQIILRNEPQVVVRDGFLERVTTYCESEEQVLGVFQVVQPVNYPKGAKFAVSDDAETRNKRLVAECANILNQQLNIK